MEELRPKNYQDKEISDGEDNLHGVAQEPLHPPCNRISRTARGVKGWGVMGGLTPTPPPPIGLLFLRQSISRDSTSISHWGGGH